MRRSQKCKKLLNLTVFFALLGSAHIKAAHKHVGEIDPWIPIEMQMRHPEATFLKAGTEISRQTPSSNNNRFKIELLFVRLFLKRPSLS